MTHVFLKARILELFDTNELVLYLYGPAEPRYAPPLYTV